MTDAHAAKPRLTIRSGPVGAGKADWALERFGAEPGRAILVVASVQQAETRVEQAIQRFGMSAPEARRLIMPFQGLVSLLLSAERRSEETIGRAFQRLALTDTFRSHIRDDDFLGKMLTAPGFIPAFQDRLREWKLAGLAPADLESAAGQATQNGRAGFARKLSELARLYTGYEKFLRDNGLRDEEDGLPRASHAVRVGTAPLPDDADLILFDGFYRFNRVQRDLLSALASRSASGNKNRWEVAVTLPYEENRPLLFAAPARALRALRQEFDTQETVSAYQHDARPRILSRLATHLFGRQEPAGAAAPESSAPVDFPVQIIDAPNPYVEAELVAREFCRLRDALEADWGDFAVILRTVGDYAPILSAVFERYGIPVGVDGPEALADNPLLRTVLSLLDIVRWDWRREDVLAFLKSSYTGPDKLTVDRLRRRAQSKGVRDGREAWLRLGEQEQGTLRDTLRLMNRIHEQLKGERAETFRFVEIVLQAVSEFGLEERIARGEPNRAERDRTALRDGKDLLEAVARMAVIRGQPILAFETFHGCVLDAWQNGAAMTSRPGDRVRITDPYDVRERPVRVVAVMGLTERVFPRRITEDPFLRDEERVFLHSVTGIELEELRGRSDDERFLFYLAVTAPADRLLLSFPRASQESDTLPSFYIDEVKAACGGVPLTAAGVDLQTEREGSAVPGPAPGVNGLEIETSNANADLSASDTQHTRLDGPPHPEGIRRPAGRSTAKSSPGSSESDGDTLSEGTEAGFVVCSRTLADVAPRPDESVNSADRLLAACADLFDPGSQEQKLEYDRRQRAAALLMQRCLADTEAGEWAKIVLASRRLPALPAIQDADLRDHFSAGKSVYSVVELETFARCPFQYLLRFVWKLRSEPEGLDKGRQSALVHSILRRYFRKRARQGNTLLAPDEVQSAQTELREMLHTDLAKNTFDTGPHHRRIVQRRLADDLDRFVVREIRFAGQFEMTPAHFHLTFGMESKEIAPDAYSSAEPLWLEGPEGAPRVGICGAIDRVDVDASGRRALVLDYEAGSPPEFSAVQRGESLQMPLYLLAIEQLFGMAGAAACYDSMRESGRRRFHRAEHVNIRQFGPVEKCDDPSNVKPLNRDQFHELTATAQSTAIRIAQSIAEGDIRAFPGNHCTPCAYKDICRTTVTEGHDGATAGTENSL